MERYAEYKDSGVEWIGEIPAEWDTFKLKALGTYQNGYAFKPEDWSNEGLPIVRIQDLTGSYTDPNFYNGSIDSKYLLHDGDVLVSWAATIGVYIWNGGHALLNQHIFNAHPNSEIVNQEYFYWLLFTAVDALDNENKHGIMMEHLTLGVFNNFKVALPPLDEQRTIAAWLDEKCAEVDGLVADTERSIELLEEYRRSVISEAVTKGIDPSAPMKDSGIEWIGEIPVHWGLKRLRYLASCQNGLSKGAEFFGTGYPFVAYGNAYRNELSPQQISGKVESTENERELYSVLRGDTLFTRTSETIDEVGFAATALQDIPNACFAGFLIRARPTTNEMLPEYAAYYYRSDIHRAYFAKEMMLVTRASLGQDLLKSLPVCVPPLAEQQAIAAHLDEATAAIDALIADKRACTERLREYRKSLISEAVTGKFKVPGVG